MFDVLGSAASLRRTRRRMEETLPKSDGLWTYPVVQEKCSCGSFTETVLIDPDKATAHFSDWRKNHVCKLRSAQTKDK